MTEQDWIELGRRAVACKGWRWMPGMLARYEEDAWCRVTEANSFGCPARVRPPNPRRAWPDFRDPATTYEHEARLALRSAAQHLANNGLLSSPEGVVDEWRYDVEHVGGDEQPEPAETT